MNRSDSDGPSRPVTRSTFPAAPWMREASMASASSHEMARSSPFSRTMGPVNRSGL